MAEITLTGALSLKLFKLNRKFNRSPNEAHQRVAGSEFYSHAAEC